jgi:hypothetical protein
MAKFVSNRCHTPSHGWTIKCLPEKGPIGRPTRQFCPLSGKRKPRGIGTSDAVLLWRKSLWWIFTLISAGGPLGSVPAPRVASCRCDDSTRTPELVADLSLMHSLYGVTNPTCIAQLMSYLEDLAGFVDSIHDISGVFRSKAKSLFSIHRTGRFSWRQWCIVHGILAAWR